jgi:hypothetical protein
MNSLLRTLAVPILFVSFLLFLGSCERTVTITGRGGEVQSGDTRIRYYVDNGTEDTAQRIVLVMGPSVAIGIGSHEVSWERPTEGDSRSSAVAPEEAAWIVWEDNTVQSIDVAPDNVSRMVALWSDGQPVPTELAEMIQKERSRQNKTVNPTADRL